MAASEVQICNRALQILGAKRITSLTQDSQNARSCSTAYEPVRDALLSDYRWNFAMARATLPEDAATPDWGRAHAYTLPSDFLDLLPNYPEDNDLSKDWQIEGQKIYTDDSSPLYLRYIKKVTDPTVFHPIFREALSWRLAGEMAEEITQSSRKKQDIAAAYQEVIGRARKANAFQNIAQDLPEDPWITARA